MNSDPGARKDGDEATPNDVPYCPAIAQLLAGAG